MPAIDDAISKLDALIAKLETSSTADLKSPEPGSLAVILLAVCRCSLKKNVVINFRSHLACNTCNAASWSDMHTGASLLKAAPQPLASRADTTTATPVTAGDPRMSSSGAAALNSKAKKEKKPAPKAPVAAVPDSGPGLFARAQLQARAYFVLQLQLASGHSL
jgi:hypothetical protein